MDKLTKAEADLIAKAKELGRAFTPTEIGMALGYEQNRASSRVAPRLKRLTSIGNLRRTGEKRHVRYELSY